MKNKGSKSKKALPRSILSNKDCIDDDEALKQVCFSILLNTNNFSLPSVD